MAVAVEVVGSFSVNPDMVVYELSRTPWTYPTRMEADQKRGWRDHAAIPGLFALANHLRRFPRADEGRSYLLAHIDDPSLLMDPRVVRRGEKLYMDFARDMHALGLLQRCSLFATVLYQKALDLRYNVDYVVDLMPWMYEEREEQCGIQSAMRSKYEWSHGDKWTVTKAGRRERNNVMEWEGPLYWLTNKTRPPAQAPQRCWLFGEAHINDLAEEIRGHRMRSDGPRAISIQPTLFDEEEST